MATYTGDSKNNSYTLAGGPVLNNNIQTGGDGNDRLGIKSVGVNVETSANANNINGGADSDKLSIQATTFGCENVEAANNTLDGGTGKNSFSIKVEAKQLKGANSGDKLGLATGNAIIGGDDGNTVVIEIKDGIKGLQGKAEENSISTGSGKDSVRVKVNGSGDQIITENTISTGNGDDKLDLGSKSKGSGARGEANNNSLTTGDGKDSIRVRGEAKNGTGETSGNSIDAGDGKDKIDVQGKGGAANADQNSVDAGSGDNKVIVKGFGNGETHADGNSITAGSGKDSIEVTGSSKKGVGNADLNSVVGGDGDDKININGRGGTNGQASYNSVDGGAGKDDINIKVQGKDVSRADGNHVSLSGGDNDLDVSVSAKGNGYINDSNVYGYGMGMNAIDFSIKAKYADLIGNAFLFGSGLHTLQLLGQGKGGANIEGTTVSSTGDLEAELSAKGQFGQVIYSNFDITGGAAHVEIEASGKSSTAAISGNTLSASGESNVSIEAKSTKANAFIQQSSLTSGVADDELHINAAGSGNTQVFGNEVFQGDGDDSLMIDVNSKKGVGQFSGNYLHTGGDNDHAEISVRGDIVQAFNNTFSGGAGDDQLELFVNAKQAKYSSSIIGSNEFDGGVGFDSIRVSASGQFVDDWSTLENVEKLDINGSKNTFQLTLSDVQSVTDIDNELFITGKKGNVVELDLNQWTLGSSAVAGYDLYSQAGSNLYVDTGFIIRDF